MNPQPIRMNNQTYPTYMKKNLLLLLSWLVIGLLCGCSDSSEPQKEEPDKDSVFLFLSTSGAGDNGYNDLILKGASLMAFNHDVNFYLVESESVEEAAKSFETLLDIYSTYMETKALFVLASSEYKEIARRSSRPAEHCRVLLLESSDTEMPEWVTTAKINRFGLGYLAGAMVSGQPAEIILAMPGEETTEDAAAGFEAGFRVHTDGKSVRRHYLSDKADGFNQQTKAYRLTDSIARSYSAQEESYATFLPLAGASNLGVYNAFTHFVHAQQVIGTDTECNAQNDYIPFSLVWHIDRLVEDYLTLWYRDEPMPDGQSYGLESDYVEMSFSDSWDPLDIFRAWEGDFTSPLPDDFWTAKQAEYLPEAIAKENAYIRQQP